MKIQTSGDLVKMAAVDDGFDITFRIRYGLLTGPDLLAISDARRTKATCNLFIEGLQKELPFNNAAILLANVEIPDDKGHMYILSDETLAVLKAKELLTIGDLLDWTNEFPDEELESQFPYEPDVTTLVASEIRAVVKQANAAADDPELPFADGAAEQAAETQAEAKVS